mgnify:CR=1 FL=1
MMSAKASRADQHSGSLLDAAESSREEATVRSPLAGKAARPQTHYVKSAGCNIAYQVTGDGPIDMIYVPGWVSNLDYHWASPRVTHVFDVGIVRIGGEVDAELAEVQTQTGRGREAVA